MSVSAIEVPADIVCGHFAMIVWAIPQRWKNRQSDRQTRHGGLPINKGKPSAVSSRVTSVPNRNVFGVVIDSLACGPSTETFAGLGEVPIEMSTPHSYSTSGA